VRLELLQSPAQAQAVAVDQVVAQAQRQLAEHAAQVVRAVLMAVAVAVVRTTKQRREQVLQVLSGLFGPEIPVHSRLLAPVHRN
jgi:hypothetical protein